MNPKIKIWGIHNAGQTSSGIGISSALVRDYIEEAMKQIDLSCMIVPKVDDLNQQIGIKISNGQFMQAKTSEIRVTGGSRSKIVQSELYGTWGEATTKPAHLIPFEGKDGKVDVKSKAMSKYCINEICIKEDVLQSLEDCYFSDLIKVSTVDVEKRMYTFEEAVLGLAEDIGYGAISRNTSPGYPYIADKDVRLYPGKHYWFGNTEEYHMENSRVYKLKEECEEIIEDAKKGIRNEHIFVDCLKDERRPIEKVDEGKTRMFSSGPLKLLIVVRMMEGAYHNWFAKNKINNGSAIGVNPYSMDWQLMAMKLQQFGNSQPNVGAGDYSGYDGSQKPIIHDRISNIINRWYDDGKENALVRKVLWAEVSQSKHLSGDTIYTWPASLPSGHPATALINTMYNGLANRYCWFAANNFNVNMLSKFTDYVYGIMLGDDIVYSVHPKYLSIYNDIKLEGYMASFGLTYTNETKTEKVNVMRNIDEVGFLKRGFRYEEILGRYVAPLQLGVVTEIPYWTKTSDAINITTSNVENCILELSLHGKEIYEEWSKKMANSCDVNMNFKAYRPSYTVAIAKVCEAEYEF